MKEQMLTQQLRCDIALKLYFALNYLRLGGELVEKAKCNFRNSQTCELDGTDWPITSVYNILKPSCALLDSVRMSECKIDIKRQALLATENNENIAFNATWSSA